MNRFLLILMTLASACPVLGGDGLVEKKGSAVEVQGAATLEIRYAGDKPQIALADLITVELRVEGSADLRVEPSEGAPTGWTLVERLPLSTDSTGKNRIRWRLTQRFAPEQPGAKIAFAFGPVKIVDGKDTQVVKFSPVVFQVNTQITSIDSAQLRGQADIEALPPLADVVQSSSWWLVAAAAVLVLAALTFGFRRYLRHAPAPSAAQLALREWQRLIAMKLPEQGRSERFVTLLTILVRQYLERQYSLPARRRTTPEFLLQLVQVAALAPEEKQFLTSFLERSEHIKFANVPITPEECAHWANAAKHFLEPHH